MPPGYSSGSRLVPTRIPFEDRPHATRGGWRLRRSGAVFPQLSLRSDVHAPVVGRLVGVYLLDQVAHGVHVGLARSLALVAQGPVERLGVYLGERRPELNEAHRVGLPLRAVRLALENRHRGRDPRVLEPLLHLGLDHRNDPEVAQEELLQPEAVLGVQPSDTGDEAEISTRPEQAGGVGEKVDVYVRPSRQPGLARPLSAEQLGVVGLVDPVDGLLPDVRRIADDRVDLLQGNHLLQAVRERSTVQRVALLGVEEARLCHEGIVRLVTQVSDREVDGGELGRKRADVYAEYLVEQLPVREHRRACGLCESALPSVGPHQERTAAARRV